MSLPPYVSIIIPIYNAQDHLEQCIDSVLNQTLKDIEVLLIDNNSTDSSAAICRKYLSDVRVRYYLKSNGGAGAARQGGIFRSKSEYVGFVNSDDWCEPDMFEKMYNAAEQSDSDIVFCNYYENDKKAPKPYESGIYTRKEIEQIMLPRTLFSINDQGLRDYVNYSSCLRLYKKSFLQKNDIVIDEYFTRYSDMLFNFEALLHANKCNYIGDEYLYHIRRSDSPFFNEYTPYLWYKSTALIDRLRYLQYQHKDYDFTSLIDSTSFFLIFDALENELKARPTLSRSSISMINKIIDYHKTTSIASQIDKERLHKYYIPAYNAMKKRNPLIFIMKYERYHSKYLRKIFYPECEPKSEDY